MSTYARQGTGRLPVLLGHCNCLKTFGETILFLAAHEQ